MPLAKYSSTSGNLVVAAAWNITTSVVTSEWRWIASLSIPWNGTTTYSFVMYNASYFGGIYIKLNSTEYGPYSIDQEAYAVCSMDYYISNASNIEILMRRSCSGCYPWCEGIIIKTGNADCMYKVSFIPASLDYAREDLLIT